MFSVQPQPTIRSAPAISSAASGEANPPETSSDHGFPANSPLATAEVASSAPERSARCSSAARHPGPRAPRPATNTGRRALRRAVVSRSTSRRSAGGGGGGNGRASEAGENASAAGRAWTSRGRLRSTVRLCCTAVATASAARRGASPAESTRIGTAPTAWASAGWSTKKFDRGWVASAVTTTRGVRLFAASVIPVSALVTPQPWCRLTAATPATLIRAYASAIVAAPVSCRAATYRAPAAIIALVTSKLPEPTTPKTASMPARTRAAPTAAATVGPSALTGRRSRLGAHVSMLTSRCSRLDAHVSVLTSRCSLLDECQDSRRGARPADDRQRRGDQQRAGSRQPGEVAQLGEPVLAAAEQRGVAGERRIEGVRRPGVGADRLHAEPDHRRLL